MNRLQNRINKLEKKAGVGIRKVIFLLNPTPEEMEMAEKTSRDKDILYIMRLIVRPGDPL